MAGDSFTVVFALYPRVTQLDFTGPFEVFARLPGARCVLASIDGGTIQGDGGITFSGVVRLADVADCALLCVPGGFGTVEAMENRAYLSELRRLGALARFVTSVCTGSLLLAAAGMLQGKRAACHWAWRSSERFPTPPGSCGMEMSSPAAASPRESTWRSRSWPTSPGSTMRRWSSSRWNTRLRPPSLAGGRTWPGPKSWPPR